MARFNWQVREDQISGESYTVIVPTRRVAELGFKILDIEQANDYVNELRDQLAEEPLESFISDYDIAARLINELESRIPEDD